MIAVSEAILACSAAHSSETAIMRPEWTVYPADAVGAAGQYGGGVEVDAFATTNEGARMRKLTY